MSHHPTEGSMGHLGEVHPHLPREYGSSPGGRNPKAQKEVHSSFIIGEQGPPPLEARKCKQHQNTATGHHKETTKDKPLGIPKTCSRTQ